MDNIILSEDENKIAEKVACYYRNPQNISYFDKELFFEAIHKNPDIHYQALKINRQFWKNENKVLRG
jgi:hypothetical protein